MNFITQITSGIAALAVGSTYYLLARKNEELDHQAAITEEVEGDDCELKDSDVESETTECLELDNLQSIIDLSNTILFEAKNSKVSIKDSGDNGGVTQVQDEGRLLEMELEIDYHHHNDIENIKTTPENDLKEYNSTSLPNILNTATDQQLNVIWNGSLENQPESNEKSDNEEIDKYDKEPISTDNNKNSSSDDCSYDNDDKLINPFPEPNEPAPILESAGEGDCCNIMESSVSHITEPNVNGSDICNKSMRMSDYVTNSYVGWPFTTFKAKHNSKVVVGIVFILWLFCALLSFIFLEVVYYSFGMEKCQVPYYNILMASKFGKEKKQQENIDKSSSTSAPTTGAQNGYAWHW